VTPSPLVPLWLLPTSAVPERSTPVGGMNPNGVTGRCCSRAPGDRHSFSDLRPGCASAAASSGSSTWSSASSSPGGCRCPCPWWRRLVHRRLLPGSRPVMANRRRQLELLLIVRRAERDGLVRVPVRRPRDRRGDLAVSAEGRARGDARKTTDSGRADWRYVQQEQSRYWSGRQQ
jgi:hypothetical protein